MLLKLELPYINRMIDGGAVVKWHKQEGEWVQYGDHLFDLHVTEIKSLARLDGEFVKELVYLGGEEASDLARHARRRQQKGSNAYFPDEGQELLVRVSASDMGIMRRIYARDAEFHEVGAVLAVLSIDPDTPLPESVLELADAYAFRVISNMVIQSDEMEEEYE